MSVYSSEFVSTDEFMQLSKIRHEERSRGGLSFEVIISEPAVIPECIPLGRRYTLPCCKDVSVEVIEKKQQAAAERRRSLEQKRASELSVKLAKIEEAARKKNQLNAVFVNQTKEQLFNKMENSEEKRTAWLCEMKEKLKSHGDWIDKSRELKELRKSYEKLAIDTKLNTAKQFRDENQQRMLARLKVHNNIELAKKRRQVLENVMNKIDTNMRNIENKLSLAEQNRCKELQKKIEKAQKLERNVKSVK